MKVSIISYTKPSVDLEENGVSSFVDIIAFCARVSNPSNQMNTQNTEKLIKYLANNKHWSPFEMVSVCLEIETTRDIARQILRHRSMSFQEFCLSGDTDIYFAIPARMKEGKYEPKRKYKLKDLYEKWTNGAKPIIACGNNREIRMPMKERIEKMMIKCYDEEEKKLTTSTIKDIFYTGKKVVYKIILSDGKEIKTTKEHKFLTKDGFLPLEDVIGLKLINSNNKITATMTKKTQIAVNGIVNYHDKNWCIEKKKESLKENGGYKYISETYQISNTSIRKWFKKHDLTYSFDETQIILGNKGKMTSVNSEETYRNNSYIPKWVDIKFIEYLGEEDTYDIEVNHTSHNYIANGIIVHNSQRYANPLKELEFELREARLQDTKNRQNSIEVEDQELQNEWNRRQQEVIDKSTETYQWAIQNGIAKEQARCVLPEGNTLSRLYVNGTLRSWIHYCELRSENGTQKEHAEIAKACAKVISDLFPVVLQVNK